MRQFVLDLKEISVKDMDIRDKTVELALLYSVKEGEEFSEDIMNWKSAMSYPEIEAHKIIQEIKKKVKKERAPDEIITAGFAKPEQDKELISFLQKAKDLSGQLFEKTTSEGYLHLVDQLKSMKKEL